jgi:hypothetical protein
MAPNMAPGEGAGNSREAPGFRAASTMAKDDYLDGANAARLR